MKQIILVVFLLSGIGPLHAAETYPKALSANDAMQYFAQNPRIKMRTTTSNLDFKIKGTTVERNCGECHTTDAYGTVKYDLIGNKVCFDWDVSFPDSGCFYFVQVSPGGFELQDDHGEMRYAWGSRGSKPVVFKPNATYEEKFERAILVEVDDKKYSQDQIKAAVIQAMKNKGWRIEKESPDKIVAYLEKSGNVYRVMGKIRGSWVGIGYVQGFAPRADGWLYNIKQQLLILIG